MTSLTYGKIDLLICSHFPMTATRKNKESGKLGSTSPETARFTMPCAAPLIWSGSFLMGHAPPFLESSSPRYYHTHTDFYSL